MSAVELVNSDVDRCVRKAERPPTTALKGRCKNFPGDRSWPTNRDWAQLNSTVGGRLRASHPLGSACHDPEYVAETCENLKKTWAFSGTFLESAPDILAPIFQNHSCDPFSARELPCRLGNYAPYSVAVAGASDIQAAIRFAATHSIRLVIKNTGHDFLGRSTGAGSLSLWTHGLKDIKVMKKYSGPLDYTGPAVRMGAGITFNDIRSTLEKQGLRILAGTCPNVGIVGGYTSGGGHGLLTSVYGLAADNVLEWEVVTAEGKHVTVSPKSHQDLYWALSGGGAGTFAVVVSTTVRAFPDGTVSGAKTYLDVASAGGDIDRFWSTVTNFQSNLGPLVDEGALVAYTLSATSLDVHAIAFPDRGVVSTKKLLEPLRGAVALTGVSIPLNVTQHPTILDMFDFYFSTVFSSIPEAQVTGGRLVPRALLGSQDSAERITKAFRVAVEAGFAVTCVATNASKPPLYSNAVFPQWRSSLLQCIVRATWEFTVPWKDMLAVQNKLTTVIMPAIEKVTPGGGVYMNEANFEQPNWQRELYGDNYAQLKKVKSLYDPSGLFYSRTGVGSEEWKEDLESSGRLCKL
ncbi:hypothetical protein GGS20DRAFT_578909 [Poronia punctata]|nr:hypothetical protein GGS20DRAFT_578909 [Poronia punctata]